jgi:hypothetical protein
MASSPATITHVEQAPPTVAACPKCNVALVPAQVKDSGSAADIIGGLLVFLGIIGGLLIFLGIIGPVGTLVGGAASFVGGLVLIGLVMPVGGRQPGLMCPSCDALCPHENSFPSHVPQKV